MTPTITKPKPLIFPDGDGEPMADNTLQYEWISILKWNIEAMLRDQPDVFVAGDLLWYPDGTDPDIRQAPDVLVAFGRPKGYRGSYKQWEEAGIAPQVVFKVWSPSNRAGKMQKKLEFYEHYGVEEYYLLYPEFPAKIVGTTDRLEPIPELNSLTSPRLGIRMIAEEGVVTVFGRDGQPFVSPVEMHERQQFALAKAEDERKRAEDERKRADALAAKLRAAGIDPDAP